MSTACILFSAFLAQAASPAADLDQDLLVAARGGNLARVKELLRQGADPDARIPPPDSEDAEPPQAWDEEAGGTALVLASAAGHVEVVKLLLGAGVEIEGVDDRGWTALMRAAFLGREEVTRLLLEAGANANARDPQAGGTALHFAVRQERIEVVRVLLGAGADPNAALSNGWTPLMWAAERGSPELVRVLLEAGADPSAKAMDGTTALSWAERRGDAEILKLLGGKPTPK